jgi:flagellar hook-associated protein 3 FlgL
MQIDAISTLVMSTLLKDSVRRSQSLLSDAQKEFSTGRHADMGLVLGETTGRDLMWRAQLSELQSLSDGNKLAGNRLDLVQSTMSSIRDVANTFLQTLTGTRNAADGQAAARAAASSALRSLTSMLNTTYNGQALFGGINSDRPPVADYQTTPPGAAATSVESAFFAAFGMNQQDSGVVTITGPNMESFLDTAFNPLFQPAQWQADWSTASNTNMTARIDTGLVIQAGSNANIEAFRQLAEAFTMVLDLGTGQLNQTAYKAIADRAIKLAGQGVLGIGFEQARLGIAEAEITTATERIALRMTTITGGIGTLENVDKYEAAMRVNTLQTQLEASYTLTGRISRLSILNYM